MVDTPPIILEEDLFHPLTEILEVGWSVTKVSNQCMGGKETGARGGFNEVMSYGFEMLM